VRGTVSLRQINAGHAELVQTVTMVVFWKFKYQPAAALQAQPDTVRPTKALVERHDQLPVAAAWPVGISQLAQAIDACQRDAAALIRAQQAK
jgi:hypothetical protein